MQKFCRWCGETKDISFFHKNKKMKDGRINKCSACVVENVAKWRKKNPTARKNAYKMSDKHKTAILKGTAKLGLGKNKEKARIRSSKYLHKRRRQTETQMTEWDSFVIEEAFSLIQQRNRKGTIKWTLDHIVPLNHKLACGLHNGFNLQVVPDWWNCKKGNRNMDTFWT